MRKALLIVVAIVALAGCNSHPDETVEAPSKPKIPIDITNFLELLKGVGDESLKADIRFCDDRYSSDYKVDTLYVNGKCFVFIGQVYNTTSTDRVKNEGGFYGSRLVIAKGNTDLYLAVERNRLYQDNDEFISSDVGPTSGDPISLYYGFADNSISPTKMNVTKFEMTGSNGHVEMGTGIYLESWKKTTFSVSR